MYQYIPLNIFTWVLFFPLILSLPAVSSDPRATPAGNLTCGTGRYTTTTAIPAFVQVMERISSYLNDSNSNFAVTNFTSSSSPPFYVLVQCHQDLSLKDCLVCYAVSRTIVPGCLPAISGRIYLDGCFVRYDNYSFFQEAIDPATDATNCNSSLREGGSFDFNRSVVDLVGNVTQVAVRYGGFGSMDLKGVYGLAQCWDSLSNEECSLCLNEAISEAISCLPSAEGRVMNAGCFLRYSTENFINNYSKEVPGRAGDDPHTLQPNNTSQSDMGRSGFFLSLYSGDSNSNFTNLNLLPDATIKSSFVHRLLNQKGCCHQS